jgi:hypothetical protein
VAAAGCLRGDDADTIAQSLRLLVEQRLAAKAKDRVPSQASTKSGSERLELASGTK